MAQSQEPKGHYRYCNVGHASKAASLHAICYCETVGARPTPEKPKHKGILPETKRGCKKGTR